MIQYIQKVYLVLGTLVVLCAMCSSESIKGLGGKKPIGGYVDIKTDNAQVKKALQFAFEELQRKDNSLYASRPGKILNAQSQVVAGVNYKITFEVEYTNCRAASHGGPQKINAEDCRTTKVSKCTVIVWDQAWRKPPMQLTFDHCGESSAVQQP